MISALLIAYALVLAVSGRVLRSRQWTTRSPRLAIVTWQCLTAGVVVAVVTAGVALLVPTLNFSADFARLIRACFETVRSRYTTPAGAAAGVVGVGLSAAVVARLVGCLAATSFRTARWRRHHVAALNVLGTPGFFPDGCVLAEDIPFVYCVPGPRAKIVVTTGAMRQLTRDELAAVLSHERAHLRQRHSLLLVWTAALAQAFPWSRLARTAHEETSRLVELLADDTAARSCNRLDLAAALLHLAGNGGLPRYALGATDSNAAQRVRRLIDPPKRVSPARTRSVYTMAGALLLIPALTLVAPAVAGRNATFCPVHIGPHG